MNYYFDRVKGPTMFGVQWNDQPLKSTARTCRVSIIGHPPGLFILTAKPILASSYPIYRASMPREGSAHAHAVVPDSISTRTLFGQRSLPRPCFQQFRQESGQATGEA